MEKVYNSLANNPRLLVLDSRSLQSYNAGHIKGSFCVTLSSDGKSLQKLAGSPWSSKCWWDRDVLLVTSTASPSPSQSPSSSKKKKRRLEEKSSDADVVLQFLSKESLVKSLLILGGDDTATTIIGTFSIHLPTCSLNIFQLNFNGVLTRKRFNCLDKMEMMVFSGVARVD
jgi:hypothetical protein